MAKRVLIVSTSHDKLGDTDQLTGSWLEEIAAPYYVFKEAGCEVVLASIKGGAVPLDEASLSGDFFTPAAKRFKDDAEAWAALQSTTPVADISTPADFDAVYLPGGHGIMYDGPDNADLARVLGAAAAAGKVVSAVCHGPAGLVGAQGPDGKPLVAGKKVTGFTNSEEAAVGKTHVVPWLLEDKLQELGGQYVKQGDWAEFVVTDGRLVTGQNPSSSAEVAKAVVALL